MGWVSLSKPISLKYKTHTQRRKNKDEKKNSFESCQKHEKHSNQPTNVNEIID
jgi:hypothetical protein